MKNHISRLWKDWAWVQLLLTTLAILLIGSIFLFETTKDIPTIVYTTIVIIFAGVAEQVTTKLWQWTLTSTLCSLAVATLIGSHFMNQSDLLIATILLLVLSVVTRQNRKLNE